MFVDGRYTLQAAKQVDTRAWKVEPLIDPSPESWLTAHLVRRRPPRIRSVAAHFGGSRTAGGGLRQGQGGTGRGRHQPARFGLDRTPGAAARPGRDPRHAIFRRSGDATSSKRIRGEIERLGVDALVLSDSHAVAWTFNIRGADVSHTPLPLSYALVPKDGRPTVFIDHRKLSNSARDHLEQSADVAEPDALTPELAALAQARRIDRARQRHRRRRAEPPDRQLPAARWCAAAIRWRCSRPARTRPRSKAPATRTGATRWRWRGSWPGSIARRRRAR